MVNGNTLFLTELLSKSRCQVLCNLQCFTGYFNSSNSLGLFSSNAGFGHTLFDGNVIRILRKEIRHGTGVFLLQFFYVGHIFFIRHLVSENLGARCISDCGVRCVTPATIGLHGNLFPSLGFDGELNFIEIGKFLSAWSLECLHAREFLISCHALDVINRHVVKRHQKCKLVNGHVLKHTLRVTFEAFPETLCGWLVGVVGHKRHVRVGHSGGVFTHVANVLAYVLVVSHEHCHVF
mmetsp:Transcript_52473/g.77717  ORF Transcript_52473/g.77717 Transcript_52473/m.77717 type:complete len:236 (+) Transcript_52473:489-1196(+)